MIIVTNKHALCDCSNPSDMPSLIRETNFLLLFVFLISLLLHYHQPALFRRRVLILDRLLTFLVPS